MGEGSDAYQNYQTNAAFYFWEPTMNRSTILQNSVAVRCDRLTIWLTEYVGVSEMGIPI
jgi:hypothetical protein